MATVQQRAALAADEIMEAGSARWPAMAASIARYLTQRIPPGGCLRAILANDLTGAAIAADETNAANLAGIARAIYHYLPTEAYGSPDAVSAWLRGNPDA